MAKAKTTKAIKKKLSPRLTDEQKKRIDELRKAGTKVSDIVRELGVKTHQVHHYAKKTSRKARNKVAAAATSYSDLDAIHKKLRKAEDDVIRYRKILAKAVRKEKNKLHKALSKKYGVK